MTTGYSFQTSQTARVFKKQLHHILYNPALKLCILGNLAFINYQHQGGIVCCSNHVRPNPHWEMLSLLVESFLTLNFPSQRKEPSMVTITNVIQYLISKHAQNIHQLKTTGVVKQTVKKYAYLSPDGKSFRNKLPPTEESANQWCWTAVEYEKLSSYMSPKHPQWQNYQVAKYQASLLLTVRHLLKINNETVPDIGQIKEALKKGLLADHCGKNNPRTLAFRAFRYLHKLNNRLMNRPEKFAAVQYWVQEKVTTSTKSLDKEPYNA